MIHYVPGSVLSTDVYLLISPSQQRHESVTVAETEMCALLASYEVHVAKWLPARDFLLDPLASGWGGVSSSGQ